MYDTYAMRNSQELTRDPPRRQKVQSAEYGLVVLKTLGRLGGAATLSHLAAELEAPAAKLHRYLASLKDTGFVEQDPQSGRYLLGAEAIAIGLAAMRQTDVVGLAAPALAELAETMGVSAFVAILGNGGPTIMRWEEPLQAVTVNVRAGSILPVLWSATGRAFGAFGKAQAIDALIQSELKAATSAQKKLIGSRKAAEAMFDEVRQTGCAVVRDVLLNGISAVAAPVFDAHGKVSAVITALGTSGQIDASPKSKLAAAVMARAEAIGVRLGYTSKASPVAKKAPPAR